MVCWASCCCCCTSTRGASFFCTSIHIFLGLYLSFKWIMVTYVNGLGSNYFEDHRMQVLFPMLLLYLSIFLVIGCINFIAVERELSGILKFSMRAFVLLQISMLLTNTLLAFAFPEEDSDLEIHRFYHIKYVLINVIATSIYFYVIWRFVYSLENGIYEVHKKRRKHKCSSASTQNFGSPVVEHHSASPSAPWTESPTTSRSLQEQLQAEQRRRESEVEDDQTLPLKSNPVPEPQPCSSKS